MADVTGTRSPGTPETRPPAPVLPAAHRAAVARLQRAYAAIPPGSPVRLAKRTSNLFRFTDGSAPAGLDVSAFGHVLQVDPVARTAVVGGMTTYEDLVDATLPHGLMPLVVPQLKTITLGGAVTGLGIESTSLRSGLPHESVTSRWRSSPATAGWSRPRRGTSTPRSTAASPTPTARSATRSRSPSSSSRSSRTCTCATSASAPRGLHGGDRADRRGRQLPRAPGRLRRRHRVRPGRDVPDRRGRSARWRRGSATTPGSGIYYQSIRGPQEDFLTIRDYLWRWDTDWFWCSRAFGVQNPVIRRLWPRRYRRSDVYRKLVAFDRRHGLSATMNAAPRRARRGSTSSRTWRSRSSGRAEFLRFFADRGGHEPGLDVPAAAARRSAPGRCTRCSPATGLRELRLLGHGRRCRPAPPTATTTGRSRTRSPTLGGHKGLYSTSFYSRG